MGREVELVLEIRGEGGVGGFCFWLDSCGDVFLDLFMRFERVGEGWKDFFGEESVVFWLVGGDREDNVEEVDLEGCV